MVRFNWYQDRETVWNKKQKLKGNKITRLGRIFPYKQRKQEKNFIPTLGLLRIRVSKLPYVETS